MFSEKIYTADKNFTRPPVATVATNSKSVLVKIGCQDVLSRLVVKIVVILREISLAYLRHISGISRFIIKIGCQDRLSRLVVKIVVKIGDISSASISSVAILGIFFYCFTFSIFC